MNISWTNIYQLNKKLEMCQTTRMPGHKNIQKLYEIKLSKP